MEMIRLGRLLPGAIPVGEGINCAKRGFVQFQNSRETCIVKLLPIREICVELLCASLGRIVGLPIPEPAMAVGMDGSWWAASVDVGYPNLNHYVRMQDPVVNSHLKNWAELTKAGCFDELIANGDRNRGNILYDGLGGFFLIDHGLALGECHAPDSTVGDNSFLAVAKIGLVDEFSLQRLRKQCHAEVSKWPRELEVMADDQLGDLGLDEAIREALIIFIARRTSVLADLFARRIPLKQSELGYGS